MRQTITIPAAGVTENIPNLTGRSIIVEEMGVYPTAADVPTFDFKPGIKSYPLYPRSTYPNNKEFSGIRLTGTAESAGDEIKIITTDQCLQLDINLVYASSYLAVPGTTFTKTAADAAATLSAIELQDAAGNLPKSITVSALSNPLLYAFNTEPDRATDKGHVLLQNIYTAGSEKEAQLLEIEGIDFILNWNYANAIAGSNAVISITPRY